jgi:hypothetical protein
MNKHDAPNLQALSRKKKKGAKRWRRGRVYGMLRLLKNGNGQSISQASSAMTSTGAAMQVSPQPAGQCPEKPWMTPAEIVCLQRWIPKRGQALEFGMGGSSRFFFENGIGTLWSVESDPAWLAVVLQDPFLDYFRRKDRFVPWLAEIGAVIPNGLGYPAAPPHPDWLRYHQGIWGLLPSPDILDFVLIDGRFRLACACQTLLRCPQKPLIVIHDFSDRPAYHPILDFVETLETAERTVVVRQKEHPDWKALALLLQEAQFKAE